MVLLNDYEISLENVIWEYADTGKPALDDISFQIPKGQIVLISGPCEAGKTTLCCCFNGLIPHYFPGKLEGKVYVKGIDTKESTIGELSQKCGMVFQDPTSQLVCPTVEDEIAFGPENLGMPREELKARIKEIIKSCRLEGFELRVPQTLSGGEQQAVAVASIMAMNPDVFVLDEPTSNLDPLGSQLVFSLINKLAQEENKTFIIVSHNIQDLVTWANEMYVLSGGKIVYSGLPETVLADPEKLNQLGLGVPQVTTLAGHLEKYGISLKRGSKLPITLEDTHEALTKVFKEANREGKLKTPSYRPPSRIKTRENPVIIVENLTHYYPLTKNPAIHDIDLEIYEGEFVGIIGQNGSGKTTLVKHFNGLLLPSEGSVKILGEDTRKMLPSEIAKRVGYIFQNPDLQIFETSVRKEVEFGLKNIGVSKEEADRRIKDVLGRLELLEMVGRIPKSLGRGSRQRVALASVLVMEPKVLVVDEPTTGQDPKMAREVMDITKEYRKKGNTVIVISHNMNLVAEYVDRLVVMKKGEIVSDGNVREVFQQTDLLKKTYLTPPQITELALGLQEYGVPPDILTVDEMCEAIVALVGK
jgi:energy-coupling factor transport system ATP-binding protein